MPFPNKATQFKSGQQAVEAGRQGGLIRSDKKKQAAFIRELEKRNPNLTEAQKEYIYLVRDGKLDEVFKNLLTEVLMSKDASDAKKLKLMEKIISFLPQKIETKNMNMNVEIVVPKEAEGLIKEYEQNRIHSKASSRMENPDG